MLFVSNKEILYDYLRSTNNLDRIPIISYQYKFKTTDNNHKVILLRRPHFWHLTNKWGNCVGMMKEAEGEDSCGGPAGGHNQ